VKLNLLEFGLGTGGKNNTGTMASALPYVQLMNLTGMLSQLLRWNIMLLLASPIMSARNEALLRRWRD
jgi:hypothetical protein